MMKFDEIWWNESGQFPSVASITSHILYMLPSKNSWLYSGPHKLNWQLSWMVKLSRYASVVAGVLALTYPTNITRVYTTFILIWCLYNHLFTTMQSLSCDCLLSPTSSNTHCPRARANARHSDTDGGWLSRNIPSPRPAITAPVAGSNIRLFGFHHNIMIQWYRIQILSKVLVMH